MAVSDALDTGTRKDVGEGSVAIIQILIRRLVVVIINEDIEVSIPVEIAPNKVPEWKFRLEASRSRQAGTVAQNNTSDVDGAAKVRTCRAR